LDSLFRVYQALKLKSWIIQVFQLFLKDEIFPFVELLEIMHQP